MIFWQKHPVKEILEQIAHFLIGVFLVWLIAPGAPVWRWTLGGLFIATMREKAQHRKDPDGWWYGWWRWVDVLFVTLGTTIGAWWL
jgi:hypothetical protein